MKLKNILLFEADTNENFYPFSIMHPVFELRCGALRLFEKIIYRYPDINLRFAGRKHHLNSFLKRFGLGNNSDIEGETLILNAQIIPNNKFFSQITNLESDTILMYKDIFAGIYLKDFQSSGLDEGNPEFEKIINLKADKISLENTDYLGWIYEALDYAGQETDNDIELINNNPVNPNDFSGAYIIKPGNVFIGENVSIAPGAVIDASNGRIYFGDNVKIMPQATIIGPVSIGDNSTVKVGAKIYENCCFGEWCKIGGEIENTIIQSYSNKQHEGFLGHSFIGEWVNLGADTNNSDLKNTYGQIKIRMNDRIIDTGRMFMGLLCGDHTKSSINAMFTTGSVAGICSIIVREWFMPNFIKSFSWGGKADSPAYHFNKAIETAKIVMNRRNRVLTEEEIILMEEEYKRTTNK